MFTKTPSNTLVRAPFLIDSGSGFLVVKNVDGTAELIEVHKFAEVMLSGDVRVDVVRQPLQTYESAVEKTRKLLAMLEKLEAWMRNGRSRPPIHCGFEFSSGICSFLNIELAHAFVSDVVDLFLLQRYPHFSVATVAAVESNGVDIDHSPAVT